MKIAIDHKKHAVVEITLSEYEVNELSEWDKLKKECIIKIIKGRDYCLYTNGYSKSSILNDFGALKKGSINGNKYSYLQMSEMPDITALVEDADFYLGQIFILLGKLSQIEIENFNHYLNYGLAGNKYTTAEFVYMEEDGKTLYWVNPKDPESFFKELPFKESNS